MSRNFDLMQEAEDGRAFDGNPTMEPVCFTSGNHNGNNRSQSTGNGALRLVQQVFLLQTQTPPRAVVFAGIDHGNGCSGMAASVAEALAGNARGAVCLVEANFRSPALPAMLGTTNHHGLTNALIEEGSIRTFAKPVCDNTLWLLSSGSLAADSPNLLNSQRLKARVMELRNEFDFIIIDAPPLTRYADAIAVAQVCDGIVLVLEAEETRREAALMVVETLRSAKVPILGAVLNKRTFPIPEKIYSRL